MKSLDEKLANLTEEEINLDPKFLRMEFLKIGRKLNFQWTATPNFYILDPSDFFKSLHNFEFFLDRLKNLPVNLGLRRKIKIKKFPLDIWIGKEVLIKIQGKLYHSFRYLPTMDIINFLKEKEEQPDPILEDGVFASNRDYLNLDNLFPFFTSRNFGFDMPLESVISWILWQHREKLFDSNQDHLTKEEKQLKVREQLKYCKELFASFNVDVLFDASFKSLESNLRTAGIISKDKDLKCFLEYFDPEWLPKIPTENFLLFEAIKIVRESQSFRSYFLRGGEKHHVCLNYFSSYAGRIIPFFKDVLIKDKDFKYHMLVFVVFVFEKLETMRKRGHLTSEIFNEQIQNHYVVFLDFFLKASIAEHKEGNFSEDRLFELYGDLVTLEYFKENFVNKERFWSNYYNTLTDENLCSIEANYFLQDKD